MNLPEMPPRRKPAAAGRNGDVRLGPFDTADDIRQWQHEGIVTYPHPAATQKADLFTLVEAALMRGKAQSGERIGVAL